jgi:RimJ/RimL family protein N-acetyltransferase
MPAFQWQTERLTLRPFNKDDLENLYQLDNDPHVMRFINGGLPTPRAVIQERILPTFLKRDRQHAGFGFWAAQENTSRQFLGWFSFRPTGPDVQEVTLGFRLRRAVWGKGYATEGARALLERGFSEMGVQRVVATTYEENLSSQRVMEKIGMKPVRRFRIGQEDLAQADTFYTNSVELWEGEDLEYAIEKTAWEQRHSKQLSFS